MLCEVLLLVKWSSLFPSSAVLPYTLPNIVAPNRAKFVLLYLHSVWEIFSFIECVFAGHY